MIPILYDKFDLSDFTSTGYGALTECISCEVTEEVNGIYELTFQYPTTGRLFSRMVNYGGVVACTHDHNGDVQLFDIYKYDAPIDGIVTFYCQHVAYRLSDFIYLNLFDESGQVGNMRNPAELFANWNNMYGVIPYFPANSFAFTDHTGYPPSQMSARILSGNICSIWDAMRDTSGEKTYGSSFEAGCVLQIWKGEWKFDRFNVDYYIKRGQNKGVQFRFGKNIINVERTRDWGETVSVIYPMWGSAGARTSYDPVFSPSVEISRYPWEAIVNTRIEQMLSGASALELRPPQFSAVVMDVSEVFSDEPTQAQVDAYCLEYMSKNSTWRSHDNISVETIDLYDSAEASAISELNSCTLGDFVNVYYADLGIVSENVEIMSLTYDVLRERIVELQLNDLKTTYGQVLIDSIGGKK